MRTDVELELCRRPLERIEADVVVAGFFSDDRPLRGAAGRLDWRLCGQLSELLSEGRIVGTAGSALLFPGSGPIAASRVLLLGLGPRRQFGPEGAQDVIRDAVQRCLGLGANRLALTPLGIAQDDFARNAGAFVGGLSEAVRSAERAPDKSPKPIRVVLSLGSRRWRDDVEALTGLVDGVPEPRIRLRVEPTRSEPPRGPARQTPRGQSLYTN